jgi:alpha,alpha-trehalase
VLAGGVTLVLAPVLALPGPLPAATLLPLPPSPPPPQQAFGKLFAAVEMARIFPDDKEFADAVPLRPPQRIMEDYRRDGASVPADATALGAFVVSHFRLPQPAAAAAPAPAPPAQGSDSETVRLPLQQHIDALWDELTRTSTTVAEYGSLLSLPCPYVVPGGRFREIYYWDSYFTMLGLRSSGREDLLADMLADFTSLVERFGHVPNGTRTYYLSRSQPPFLFEMIALGSPSDEAAAYAHYLPQLRAEYDYWMSGRGQLGTAMALRRVVRMPSGAVLNRYWDDADTPRDEAFRTDTLAERGSGREPRAFYRDVRAAAESGWDFSSRWFADGHSLASIDTTQVVPVDLNVLLLGLEQAIAAGCSRGGDAACAKLFTRRASERHTAIDKYLWDARAGVYRDYRWTTGRRIERLSAATLYPLFLGAASASQARAVTAAVRATLLQPGGIVATEYRTGQQWDAPNGWAPLQWLAVAGLRRYGESALAAVIACRWIANVNAVYRRTGKLMEKYDVDSLGREGGGGEYPGQDGFGWTNGVTRQLLQLYPEDANRNAEQCPPDQN